MKRTAGPFGVRLPMPRNLTTLLPRGYLVLPLSLCALAISLAQTAPSADAKLTLKAALVLTPGFCANQALSLQGAMEIGTIACSELETGLNGVFPSLTRVADASSIGEAQVVLQPRFVDSATSAISKLGKVDFVTTLEWTAKDASGRTLWIATAKGSARTTVTRDKKKDRAPAGIGGPTGCH